MLKLRRLELSGFKSFVDPVGLDVHGGMTAIVGPNGCGKSNIADAVVWVLGERSAKSLRGEKMEDIIFAGAKTRKPLGMAEVTLELVSDNGFAGSDDGQVSIGRRVFRSGESQYFLNGKSVRLKDIRDLLMDTGLGIRDYSMIEQGKIGLILSGKPQERRRLLEEAAGITRYRERRRVAEIKLEEARANLERLDDVIAEVERAVRSLKRQAGAASRFQARQQEHRDLLRRVLTGRWSLLQGRLGGFRHRLGELEAQDAELSARLHRQEADLAEGREQLEKLSRQLAERHGRVAELAATIEGKQEFLKGSRHRLQEIAERLAAGEATADHRRQRSAELESSLRELEARRADLLSARERAATEVDADQERISEVEALLAAAESQLESLRARLLSSINGLSGLRNRLHREQVEREKGDLRRRHVADELEVKEADLEQATRHRDETRRRVEELESNLAATNQEVEALAAERDEVLARLEGTRAHAEALEDEIQGLQRRQQVLTELEEQQEEKRARLQSALEEIGLARRPFLADQIEVPEGWAASLDLFLGELEDAVLLEPDDDALALARSLRDSRATGRLLLPHGTAHFVHLRIDDPAVHSSLGEALGLPAAVAAVLPPAYLVDSPADAQRLARSNPGVAFISRNRLWAQAGAIQFQGSEAKPGPLARDRELAELGERLPPLATELESTEQLVGQLAEEAEQRAGRIRELEREAGERRAELAAARARFEEAGSRHHRLASERQTLSDELAEIDRELGQVARQVERLASEVRESEAAHAELESAFDAAQSEVERTRDARESTRTTGASRRGRLEVLAERLDSHDEGLARLERELQELRRQLEQWHSEAERLAERQTLIQETMDQAERELQAALDSRGTAQQDVIGQQDRLDRHRAGLRELEARLAETRQQRDELRAEIGEVRVGEAEARQDAEHLAADFRDQFHEEPPGEPGAPPDELDQLEVELTRRRELLERMGPVNVLAASEYEEQAERLDFLTTQRADVADSVDRLKQTIREINETSSQRFKATFDEVNQHFSSTFVDLFRGGEAEMRLLEDDDLLESPIEIVARPPGKRLQNIMLLSGGEKALTAIALLFALFKTKPSPFCILDEVDAPLDDVNTIRFLELLRRMSESTQFMVITHNKLTMEAANLLYGVTMQERGVSSLVAVELDAVQPAATAAEPAAATA